MPDAGDVLLALVESRAERARHRRRAARADRRPCGGHKPAECGLDMATVRDILAQAGANLDESMGVRAGADPQPSLAPVPDPRDVGRRPLRNVGRVDIGQVVPDRDQPRAEFSEEGLERLAASIRESGQLAPIRVRWSGPLGKWVIIAGERRWRATRQAGLPTIDCVFVEGELSRGELLAQQLIENLLREDLRAVEEARAFRELL